MFARTLLNAAAAATLLLCTSAQAQLFRAYLASDGNDGNPCTLPAPCRLLPAALGAVANGGEIWMLDSANYNTATVNVTKSVSILAVPGVVGSVLAIGGPAISIGASGLSVALRNLVIAPLAGGGGTDGVVMTGASALTIENSLISNVGRGVQVYGAGQLKMTNTTLRGNSVRAIDVGQGANATISATQMLANANGVGVFGDVASTTTAGISDSVISGGSVGVYAQTSIAGAVVRVSVIRSAIEHTTETALRSNTGSGGSASLSVSGSMIANNTSGWRQQAGGVILSLGNNHFTDNGSSEGVLTPTPLQ
jgi:hypothetical protein